jgi:spermidine synthase
MVTERRVGDQTLYRLRVGTQFRMGGGRSFAERRMGHLPLLLAGEAARVLYLGVGTGATLSAVLPHPVRQVDAVELVPEVIACMDAFAAINDRVHEDPRVTLHAADARRFVSSGDRTYDAVVADLFHPARDGAGMLYTREHFRAVSERLTPGGLFMQWLPLHQLDTHTLALIIRAFAAVFPEVHSHLAIYNVETAALGLLGRRPAAGGPPWSVHVPALRRRLAGQARIREFVLDEVDLLATYMLDREALLRFAGDGPLNTDLHPRVVFESPRVAYADPADLAWRVLDRLLDSRVPCPASLVAGLDEPHRRSLVERVARQQRASTLYLRAEIARQSGGGSVTGEVLEGYVRAYEEDPLFPAARGRLYALAAAEPPVAERVLPRMCARSPEARRPLRAWIEHLQRTGDGVRLAEALSTWKNRFGMPAVR